MLFPSKERIKQWVKNHSSEIIKIGGEWDEAEKAVGVSMKEGYIGDRIIEAIARYARDRNPPTLWVMLARQQRKPICLQSVTTT